MRQNKQTWTTLTKNDLTKIRGFLPHNWRLKIAEMHDGLALRQITDVFNLRTKNPADNKAVWETINEVLRAAEQPILVQKIEKHLSICAALDNVIQKSNQ